MWGVSFETIFFFLCILSGAHSLNDPSYSYMSETVACNISIDAGPDMTICQPGQVQLQGSVDGNALFTLWTPPTGLNDPNILTPTADISGTITYTLTGWGIDPANPNVIVNGDFEQGNVGFTSDYVYVEDMPGSQEEMVPAGTYTVINNPFLVHAAWSPCEDHTPGAADQMMLINGELALQNFWCQTVTIQPNTYYNVEAWVSSVHPSSPAVLQFSINGTPIGQIINAPSTPCEWIPFNAIWNSGSATTAEICIINLNTEAFGNDFALDDISMVALCEVFDEVTIFLEPEPAPVPEITGPESVCDEEVASYLADLPSEPEILNYTWTITGGTIISGQGSPEIMVEWQNVSGGTICLMIETACDENENCFTVDINSGPQTPQITGPAALCPDETGVFSIDESQPSEQYNWVIPPQLEIIGGQGTNEIILAWLSPGTADVCVEVSNECGTSYDCFTVDLHPDHLTFFDTLMCAGSTIVINGTVYGNGNNTGTEIFNSVSGCDSIVEITIEEVPELEIFNEVTLCHGDSIFLENEYQDEAGIYVDSFQTIFGCDSVIITEVILSNSDTTYISGTTCDASEAGITIETYTSGNCDSIVITELLLAPTDTTHLMASSCIAADTGVQTIHLQNIFGCDSLVITHTEFQLSDTTNIFNSSCVPGDTGVFIQQLTNTNGCDSIVITTIGLLLSDTTEIFQTSCMVADTGVFTQLLTNVQGCDSAVITTISFSLSDTTYVTDMVCSFQDTGTTTTLLINQNGCDSLIIYEAFYAGSDTTYQLAESCSVMDTGQIYLNLVNQSGCDSIISVYTTYLPPDTTILSAASCNPQDTGYVTEHLSNLNGCDSIVVTHTILELPELCTFTATFVMLQPRCAGDTAWLQVHISEGLAPFQLQWTNNGNAGIEVIPSTGIYNIPLNGDGEVSLHIISANGLAVNDSLKIIQPTPLEIHVEADSQYNGFNVACFGDATGSGEVEVVSPGTQPVTFLWSSGETNERLQDLTAGVYSITATDANGCTSADSLIITQPPPMQYEMIIDSIPCQGVGEGGFIIINMEGGVIPWMTSHNGAPFQSTFLYSGLNEGVHDVVITDANGCSATETFTLETPGSWFVELGPDTSLVYGSVILIKPVLSGDPEGELIYVWSDGACSNCSERMIELTEDVSIGITVTDDNGCTAFDFLHLDVFIPDEVFIPNVFSPNDDGINDRFLVFTNQFINEIREISIFDRWGNMVFQKFNVPSNDPAFGWDGTMKEKPFNPAVFAYKVIIDFPDGNRRSYYGDVTLLR